MSKMVDIGLTLAYERGVQDGYVKAVDMACAWMRENVALLWESPCNPERIVELFKRAMKNDKH